MSEALVIIPAFNEERNIGRTLSSIYETGVDLDVVVINDGSTDGTGAVLKEFGCDSITLPFNLGYGAAIQTGFKYAADKGYKYVIQFDADGQHDAGDLITIVDELKRGDADIVIGSRFLGRGTFKPGLLKMAAISIFRFLIKHFTGVRVTDPTSGLKGLTKPLFQYYSGMGNYPVDFPDADVLIQIIRCKYRIREFPANMRERTEGKSMHSGLKPVYYFIKLMLSISIVLLREKFSGEGFCKNG